MWTRNYWVLMTYIKRPVWWLTTAAVVAAVIALYWWVDEQQYSTVDDVLHGDVLHGEVVRTFSQLDSVIGNDPSQPVELDYFSLCIEATERVFPHPRSGPLHIGVEELAAIHAALKPVEKLTNVVSVAAGNWVDQATIERIAKFPTLKRLSIGVELSDDTIDLQPLTNLHQLEELQLGRVGRVVSRVPLSELPFSERPKLEKLTIDSSMLAHKRVLDSIAKISNLRVLSLPDLRSYPGLQDSVGTLAKAENLQEMHYGVSWDQPDVISAVQSQVPGIAVKPSIYRPARHIALFAALFIVLVSGLLGMHVTGQFSLPASRLAPNFRGSHYLVAGLLFAALIVFSIGLVISVGANVLTTISLILLSGAFHFWSSTRLVQAKSMSLGNKIVIWLSSLLAVFLPMAVPFSLLHRPMLVEDLLMSGQVLIPLSFIATAAWLLKLAYHNLETRLPARLERGIPATLSFQDIQAASHAQRDSQIGQSPNPLVKICWKLPIIGKAMLGMIPFSIMLLVPDDGIGGYWLLMICFGAFVVSCYLIGAKWWKEMPYVASAITRPPNREGHVDRLMRGVAKDLASIVPLFIASLVVASLLGGLRLEGIGYRIATGVVVVSSVSLAVYAVILWVIAVRSITGAIVLALVWYGPCFMVTMVLVMPENTLDTSWKTLAIVVTACIVLTFAIAAIVLARRYFYRLEWARFL